jgi:hypothetical protein
MVNLAARSPMASRSRSAYAREQPFSSSPRVPNSDWSSASRRADPWLGQTYCRSRVELLGSPHESVDTMGRVRLVDTAGRRMSPYAGLAVCTLDD